MDRKLLFKIILLTGVLCAGFSIFAQTPYNIVMNIYDDPKTKMAFNWFTTSNTTGEQIQISIGTGAFTPFITVACNRTTTPTNVHKAVVTGLTPNTTYSFRVGKAGLWSSIGTFTTAKDNKDDFSFIYVTDSQIGNNINMLTTNAQAAFTKYPNTRFWLHCGDLTSYGDSLNHWNRFFEKQQNYFYHFPFAPIMGNHDAQSVTNFKQHLNLHCPSFDSFGSTYTFIYGDAQFFAINSEQWIGYSDILNSAYITALKNWMSTEVAAHQDIKWRIVYYHKSIYTGAYEEQNEPRCAVWHNAMAPFFDDLNIDLALQGHSHIYDVIGPVYNINTVQGSVSGVSTVNEVFPKNASSKSGGFFSVQKGTLYFTNGTFGNSFFYPFLLTVMPGSAFPFIPHYYSLMTGRYGQTSKSTYSNISVSTSSITISTYEVIDSTTSQLLDQIMLVKYCATTTDEPGSQVIATSQTWNTNKTITNNIVVPLGVTLTITATAFFSTYKITVKCGGKLVVSGGTIDDGNVIIQGGGKLILSNNGIISLGNYDNLEIHLGAEYDVGLGEILLK
ncbi:MAG: metallophosphoesterase family protein [Bacteroidales bacterium]|jgi:hypothetical protein|nr:metallophosphoesterase family protein [Bacteroidales bacterium]